MGADAGRVGMVGMEIRVSVTSYVHDRIIALRQIQSLYPPPHSDNTSLLPPPAEITAEYLEKTYDNPHPDVLAHIEDLKTKERLARKAMSKVEREGAKLPAKPTFAPADIGKDVMVDEEDSSSASKPNNKTKKMDAAAAEEEENQAEERENEKALKGPLRGGYKNASVIRGNAMKHLPSFFERGQVSSFYLFDGYESGSVWLMGWDERIVGEDLLFVSGSAFQEE